ncbi:hypothetical protein GCM10022221_53900 [Actinocorallia aurea]
MGLVLESTSWATDGRQYVGLAAAMLAAMLAGQAGWKATDWVLERRGARDTEL